MSPTSIKRTDLIDIFTATAEDGTSYTLHAFQEILDTGSFDDPAVETPGLKSMRTSDGDPVNVTDEDHFVILTPSGEVKATRDQ